MHEMFAIGGKATNNKSINPIRIEIIHGRHRSVWVTNYYHTICASYRSGYFYVEKQYSHITVICQKYSEM